MKAMLLKEAQPIEEAHLQKVELLDAVPGPGQVRLRVAACGMCHTDIHIVEGSLPHVEARFGL